MRQALVTIGAFSLVNALTIAMVFALVSACGESRGPAHSRSPSAPIPAEPEPSSLEPHQVEPQPSGPATSATSIGDLGTRRLIIPAGDAARFYEASAGIGAAESYFTPTVADIDAMTARLRAQLASPGPQPITRPFDAFHFHHIGVVRGGRRLIFTNAFCNTYGDRWLREPISVDDGGDCYFDLKYDIETGSLLELHVNGVG